MSGQALPNSTASDGMRITRRTVWAKALDVHLARMRADGVSIRALSKALKLNRSTIAERLVHLGFGSPTRAARPLQCNKAIEKQSKDDRERDSLAAGHPVTWDLINQTTCLAGSPYTDPDKPNLLHRSIEMLREVR